MTPKPKSNDAELPKHDWIDDCLKGIDQDEVESIDGWWETSAGAEFGAKKKAELKSTIETKLAEAELRGQIKELRHSVIKGYIPDNVAVLRRVLLEAQLQNLGGDNE